MTAEIPAHRPTARWSGDSASRGGKYKTKNKNKQKKNITV
jgi:hypothetical protein